MARLGPYLALVACIGVACLEGAAFADGPPKASPRRADIPLIKCALCERLATKAWRSGRALLKTSTPAKRVDELAVVELIEKLGTPWRPEGEWLTQLDIVREGKALALVDKEQVRTDSEADLIALMLLSDDQGSLVKHVCQLPGGRVQHDLQDPGCRGGGHPGLARHRHCRDDLCGAWSGAFSDGGCSQRSA